MFGWPKAALGRCCRAALIGFVTTATISPPTDAATGKALRRLSLVGDSFISRVVFSPGGKKIGIETGNS